MRFDPVKTALIKLFRMVICDDKRLASLLPLNEAFALSTPPIVIYPLGRDSPHLEGSLIRANQPRQLKSGFQPPVPDPFLCVPASLRDRPAARRRPTHL
jgi:hypothetical protein